MREQEKRPDEKAGARHRPSPEPAGRTGAAHSGPLDPAAVAALQRSVGNRVVARRIAEERHVHDGSCDHEPTVQRALVDAAVNSPGRPIEPSRRAKLEAFHQEDFSAVRVHTGPVAQRSTAAVGAGALTVGDHIVLGRGADDDETLGHEAGHVKQQRAGRVSGADNGAGLSISSETDPEERSAAADGAAFRSGAERAPSALAGPTGPHSGGAGGEQRVQRVVKEDSSSGETSSAESSSRESSSEESSSEEEEEEPRPRGRTDAVKQIGAEVEKHTKAYGGGLQGRATDEARLRFPRDMADERDTQTLSHLSFLLYDALSAVQDDLVQLEEDIEVVNEREVQGMLINDRLLFASNYNDTIDNLEVEFGEDMASLRDLVEVHQDDEDRTKGLRAADAQEYLGRLDRAETKVMAAFQELRGMGDDATAEAMRNSTGRPVVVVDAASPTMRELLTAPEHAGSVIMLRFDETDGTYRKGDKAGRRKPKRMHAEQKFLVAIHRAGLKPEEAEGPLAISGRYRPCMGCAAALRYYRDVVGFGNLDFNPNYGFYYASSVQGLKAHLRHVVEDPRYHEYIREMIDPERGGAVSTSALAWQGAPADAVENNGPEIRIPAERAGGRGYRTDSASEGRLTDSDDEEVYHTSDRELFEYKADDGGRKVGKGSRTVNAGRRAQDLLSADDALLLRQVWLFGDRDTQALVFRYYTRRPPTFGGPVSQREIQQATGAGPGTISRLILGTTGHEKRDNRVADPGMKRMPQRGRKADPAEKKPRGKGAFKKGKPLDADGRKRIEAKMREVDFYETWESAPEVNGIKPQEIPHALGQLIADLRREYTVPSMARALKTSDALKQHLNRTFKVLNPKAEDAKAAQPVEEDVEMGGTEDDREHPEVRGLQHHVDESGQHFYTHPSGAQFFWDFEHGDVRPLPPNVRFQVGQSSGARQAEPDAMDVDEEPPARVEESDDEVEETYVGKGKNPARRRR
ncbi:DUF4157 domain-containing protein [Saccharothrix sp. HUAS TT1]|uniref:eCIS core domain-containing protein n=1 Tax=unclassified Saccharothrix TaxID=2593673 RepID=UPI00345BD536